MRYLIHETKRVEVYIFKALTSSKIYFCEEYHCTPAACLTKKKHIIHETVI